MKRVALVLKSGGDFTFDDVRLISDHMKRKWKSEEELEIICFWDRAFSKFDLGTLKVYPLMNNYKGVWSRIDLYSSHPDIVDLRPFLYVDLDTAVIHSIENIFKLVDGHQNKWITLEDFWQKGLLATGLVWFPKHHEKLTQIYDAWTSIKNPIQMFRMDYFIRTVTTADMYWQQLTDTIYDFKPKTGIVKYLDALPRNANLVCFHGKPRLPQADFIPWVDRYINYEI